MPCVDQFSLVKFVRPHSGHLTLNMKLFYCELNANIIYYFDTIFSVNLVKFCLFQSCLGSYQTSKTLHLLNLLCTEGWLACGKDGLFLFSKMIK